MLRSVKSRVLEDYSRELLRKSLWIKKKKFVESFGGYCGDFCWSFEDSEVIVIVNNKLLVEFDDCYCCAC